MKPTPKSSFDYGQFLIEYRTDRYGDLRILKEKTDDTDAAMKAAEKLKNKGYSDVMIRRNFKN